MIEGVHSREGFPTTRGVLDEVYKRYTNNEKSWPFKFSLDLVLALFYKVLGRLADNNFVVDENWDETTGELSRIVNSERKQSDFANAWRSDGK